MTRRLNRSLLVLMIVVGAPAYWLFYDNRPGEARPLPVSLTDVRALAGRGAGRPPEAIAVEVGRRRWQASNMLAGGSGIQPRLVGDLTFRLDRPGGQPLFVGTARAAVPAAADGGGPAGRRPQVLSRGIVTVPLAHGQLTYVSLANGTELVLAGAAAPLEVSTSENRIRPRVLTDWLAPEDRAASFAALATLRAWQRAAPELLIVPGNDVRFVHDPLRAGLFASHGGEQHSGKR